MAVNSNVMNSICSLLATE